MANPNTVLGGPCHLPKKRNAQKKFAEPGTYSWIAGRKKRGNPIYNFNHLEKYKSVGIIIPNIWKKSSKPPACYDGKHDFLTWNLQTASDPRTLDAIIPIHLFYFLKV